MSAPKIEGPFAAVSEEVLRAMIAYAGAHTMCRQTICQTVVDLSSYSFEEFPTTIDGAIEFFANARAQAPAEYRDELVVSLGYERGYYDEGDSASLTIWFDRPETDAEMQERFDSYLQYVQSRHRDERATYERLKRKYEP